MGTTNDNSILAQALFGETRRAVLSTLFRNPDQSYYLRQMIRLIGAGQGAVQRELNSLVAAGILTRSRIGRQVFFQANPKCPIFNELRSLIVKTSGLADILRISFNQISDRIHVAFVYGSFAEGRDTAGSDVDVMIIGTVTFNEAVEVIQKAQSEIGREVNPTVYPIQEFKDKIKKGHHFLNSVIKRKKIFLIGDEHELAGLASKSVAD